MLDSRQYNYLKKFTKKSYTETEIRKEYMPICKFLLEENFLQYSHPRHIEKDSNGFPVPGTPTFIEITELGRSYLYTHRSESLRWKIPVLISIAALIVSIMALYKSAQPLQINIDKTAIITANTETTSEK